MKKLTAIAMTLTMILGLTACGSDNSSGSSSSSSESPAAASSAADEATSAESESSTAVESEASSLFTETEAHTTTHELYGISADYTIPKLDGFEITPGSSNPDYFGTFVQDNYFYRQNGETTGVDIYFELQLWNAEDAAKSYSEDRYEIVDTKGGYKAAFNIDTKGEDSENPQWETTMTVYGGTYRTDMCLSASAHYLADKSKMNEEQFRAFIMSVADSIKLNVLNENALVADDGSYNIYTHYLTAPAKAKIGGNDCDVQLRFEQFYPEAYVEAVSDDIKYEIKNDILSYNSLKWEKTSEKTDEYTPCKVADNDAFFKYGVNAGVNAEFVIKFSDEHVEVVKINGNTFSDGSKSKDGVYIYDLAKEMTDDAHTADTQQKLTDLVSDFVSTWNVDKNPAN